MSSESIAKELRAKAAAIEAAANRSDDPSFYRAEIQKARMMRLEADRIDQPKPRQQKQKGPSENTYGNMKDAIRAVQKMMAERREE